jgi:hypothetical protein
MVGGVRDIKGEVKAMKGRIEILRPPVFSRSTPAYVLFESSESVRDCWGFLGEFPFKILLDARESIRAVVARTFSNNPTVVASLHDVRVGLAWLTAKVLSDHPEYGDFVISLAPLYQPRADGILNVNRMVDEDGHPIEGIGPRADAPSLYKQSRRLRTGGDCVVVDDVLWHGHTASALLRAQLRPRAWVSVIARDQAYRDLRDRNVPVHPLIQLTEMELLDTVPFHDFLPFAPFGGVAVGMATADGPRPIVVDQLSFSKPYLLPYLSSEMLTAKASVPPSLALAFSRDILDIAITAFQRIEKAIDRAVYVGDFTDESPRCSYPLRQGESIRTVSLRTRVTDKLIEDRRALL